jgi:hypothetical protein
MGMTQVILGAALGVIIAQGAIYAFGRLAGWLRDAELGGRIRSLGPLPGSAIVGVLIRYAGVAAVCAALVTFGVWAVGDYLKARSAQSAVVAAAEPAATPSAAASTDEQVRLAAASAAEAEAPPEAPDPYADPDFKVRRPAHRGGGAASLKETLVERSEAKARAELLAEVRQHTQRSQYDCEATDRAEKYLKAGLDVWGFEAWQGKYFPVGAYKGATLAACRGIKNVVDPTALDLRSTVAQQHTP